MAIYNNGYPATYTPVYQTYTSVQAQPQNVAPVQQPVQGLNWIQGEQAAKSYLIAPNSTVVLFDSESQTIYIKSADASGMPSMKVLDYTLREPGKTMSNPVSNSQDDSSSIYATKGEIDAINSEIKALKAKLDRMIKKSKEEDDE